MLECEGNVFLGHFVVLPLLEVFRIFFGVGEGREVRTGVVRKEEDCQSKRLFVYMVGRHERLGECCM